MSECIFCRIVRGEIPSKKVFEDEHVFAFHDINPVAPVHVLIVPKKHIACLDNMVQEDQALLGYLMYKVPDIAKELGLVNGYRLVNNCGEDGMQTVHHLHFHLLGKRKMTWPPG